MELWYLANKPVFKKLYFVVSFLLLCVISALGVAFYKFWHDPFMIRDLIVLQPIQNPSPSQVQKQFEARLPQGSVFLITQGMGVRDISKKLEELGFIKQALFFEALVRLRGLGSKLRAGEYFIEIGTTPDQFIDQLVSGRVIQYELTVIEGWTFERLLMALKEAPKIIHTLEGISVDEVMNRLGHSGEHPEGRFLPETYYFPAGTTDLAFLKRAYQALVEKLQIAWEKRRDDIPLKSPYEALILASIIEKESSVIDEYAEISGVYSRRLAKNMLLQADPTVIYGLGKNYTGHLTAIHLKQPSPYNTYQQLGLPPTPIALPSFKALLAATHPKPGKSLYFVANPEGKGHVFSDTLEEHQKAVSAYRKKKDLKD